MMFSRYRKTKTALSGVAMVMLVTWLVWDSHQNHHSISLRVDPEDELSCNAKTNFVYLKMIKCASETLNALFHSFGYSHNLTFVIPLDTRMYIGWPHSLIPGFYRPTKTGKFNILCEHFVYNETTLRKIMPKDTIYITSIREPYAQFKSTLHYYKVLEIGGVPKDAEDRISEYLHNIDKYEKIYQRPGAHKRFCIPDGFSMTKNLMSFNLGMPLGWPPGSKDISRDAKAVQDYIHYLDRKFDLIMIVEYFDESLILLKRLMCWKNYKELFYRSKNIGSYEYKSQHKQEDVAMYKKRSAIDYLLYDFFNRTFWKKVGFQGADFHVEVAYFKKLLFDFNSYCDKVAEKVADLPSYLSVKKSHWSIAFNLTRVDCSIAGYGSQWLPVLKADYDKIPKKIEIPKDVPYFC